MCLESTIRVPLRARDGSIRAYALIDAADAHLLGPYRWSLHRPNGRAHRVAKVNGRKAVIFLHRVILGIPHGDTRQGDHINRDRLDNRRENLRIVTREQNSQNIPPRTNSTSRFRGVAKISGSNRWRATLRVDGKKVVLGRFATELEAAEAAREARRLHMPYATD